MCHLKKRRISTTKSTNMQLSSLASDITAHMLAVSLISHILRSRVHFTCIFCVTNTCRRDSLKPLLCLFSRCYMGAGASTSSQWSRLIPSKLPVLDHMPKQHRAMISSCFMMSPVQLLVKTILQGEGSHH